jgi:hypothetical protein
MRKTQPFLVVAWTLTQGLLYGWRRFAVFCTQCVTVGFGVENVELNKVAMASLAFNRWAKDSLPISNSIMALDVLLGIYLAERQRPSPTTFKELCWDLRHSEQAIRTIVDRLQESGWVLLEQDTRFRRPIRRLRIAPDRCAALNYGLELLRNGVAGR